jgi:hypothetical protein
LHYKERSSKSQSSFLRQDMTFWTSSNHLHSCLYFSIGSNLCDK